MSVAKKGVVVLLAAAVIVGGAGVSQAQQGTLSAARELYSAAAYDEALSALNTLASGSDAISDSGTVALYKALCLYALGRNGEGDRAVEAMVTQYPLYRPALDELAPRMRTTVIDTRKRLLPGLLQQQYGQAKAAFERQDFAGASAGFKQVIDGLADPDIASVANQPQLADLGTLAKGFRDLAEKALIPPPAPVAKAAVVLPTPVAAPPAPRVYSAADGDVTAPAMIRQNLPPFNRPVTQRKTAVVELLINERGGVDAASMVSPLDPAYDRAVVAAAKNWQYEPAKADGKPVKYQKRVQITLVPTVDK
jgi:TonB family protein